MNLKKISVKLSWMLRHCQSPLYIDLNGGWADADVIKSLKEKVAFFMRFLDLMLDYLKTDGKAFLSSGEEIDIFG